MAKHFVIPDTQVKPGVPLDHLVAAGNYIAEKKPDVIVMLGDFADMESLSSYDVGKKSFEGRRYSADIEAAHQGMFLLSLPILNEIYRQKKNKKKQWSPRMVLTLGNHEDRISRVVNLDPKLEGTIRLADLDYNSYGWNTVPFLEPVVIDGIAYCHYFTSGLMGRPVTTANALLTKKHMSSVMGHVQGRQIAYGVRADGKQMTSLFAGGFYQHDEEYLNWQGNKQWKGCWMFHEVNDGSFDEMPLSLNYLMKNYL